MMECDDKMQTYVKPIQSRLENAHVQCTGAKPVRGELRSIAVRHINITFIMFKRNASCDFKIQSRSKISL